MLENRADCFQAPELDDDPPWSAYVFAVWNLIIRPPRNRYTTEALYFPYPAGRFMLPCKTVVHRTDFNLQNLKGASLVCTLFQPSLTAVGANPDRESACVVYCHGNGSNRLDGFDLVPLLLPLNLALMVFDFSGSGMSEGVYVSLGYFEQDDLACVVEHLRTERHFSRIGIWGFSMGAVTTLMHVARDPSIAGVVADSPFCDLSRLIKEVVTEQLHLPSLVARAVMMPIKKIISRKAGFEVDEVSPMLHVASCFVPALFLHGAEDFFVTPAHSEALQKDYGGEAQRIVMSEMTHVSRRLPYHRAKAVLFLVRALRWEPFMPAGAAEALVAVATVPPKVGGSLGQSSPSSALEMQVSSLLASKSGEDISWGLVLAATSLCSAYWGAETFHCLSAGGAKGGGAKCKANLIVPSRPATLFGTITFPNPAIRPGRERHVGMLRPAEVAICWIIAADPRTASSSCHIGFAVLSLAAISLTTVELIAAASSASASSPNGAGTIAGLSCASVRPWSLGRLALTGPERGASAETRSGSLQLSLSADGSARLTMGDVTIESPPLTSSPGPVHVWCIQWPAVHGAPSPGAKELCVSMDLVLKAGASLKPAPSPSRLQVQEPQPVHPLPGFWDGAAGSALEERLAATLSTRCFVDRPPPHGTLPVDSARRFPDPLSSLVVEAGDYVVALPRVSVAHLKPHC